MIISGDGLIFEVVNGLMSRADNSGPALLKKIPICPIPGSSLPCPVLSCLPYICTPGSRFLCHLLNVLSSVACVVVVMVCGSQEARATV